MNTSINWLDLNPGVTFETGRTVPTILQDLEESASTDVASRILAHAIHYLNDPYWYAEHHNSSGWRATPHARKEWVAEVTQHLRDKGITVRRTDAEYRVAFTGRGNESSAYYTPDLTDALNTGLAMLAHHMPHWVESRKDRS